MLCKNKIMRLIFAYPYNHLSNFLNVSQCVLKQTYKQKQQKIQNKNVQKLLRKVNYCQVKRTNLSFIWNTFYEFVMFH